MLFVCLTEPMPQESGVVEHVVGMGSGIKLTDLHDLALFLRTLPKHLPLFGEMQETTISLEGIPGLEVIVRDVATLAWPEIGWRPEKPASAIGDASGIVIQ